jgi:hypothetical protein
LQVNAFNAPKIDCGHLVSLGIGAFAVWMNAACLTEAVLDYPLVERVGTDSLFRCEHVQLFARHKPQERSFARTDRAIACHRPLEFAFYLEDNLTAVTATLVLHLSSPYLPSVNECNVDTAGVGFKMFTDLLWMLYSLL